MSYLENIGKKSKKAFEDLKTIKHEKIKKVIEKKFKEEGLDTDVTAREKHVYGLYKKMKLLNYAYFLF